MSMDLDLRCVSVLFIIAAAHFLSNWMRVGPWGFISFIVVWVGTVSHALMYLAPVSYYWAEDITESMNLLLTSIEELRFGGGSVDLIGTLVFPDR